jgi:hypothetical protein
MLQELAEHYLNGKDATAELPELTGDILTRWIEHEFQKLGLLGISVELSENPKNYNGISDVIADVRDNKHIYVFSLYCEHPLISPETNRKFRAIHDYFHHYLSGLGAESSFSLYGEFVAYERAKTDLFAYLWQHESVPTLEIFPILDRVLFSEIVLQASVKLHTGEFADQKIVL